MVNFKKKKSGVEVSKKSGVDATPDSSKKKKKKRRGSKGAEILPMGADNYASNNEMPGSESHIPALTEEEAVQVSKLNARAEKKWLQLDQDRTGYLEGDEILNLAEWVVRSFHSDPKHEPVTQEEKMKMVAKILIRCDVNEDGMIDRDEFFPFYNKKAAEIMNFKHATALKKKEKGGERTSGTATAKKSRPVTPGRATTRGAIANAPERPIANSTPGILTERAMRDTYTPEMAPPSVKARELSYSPDKVGDYLQQQQERMANLQEMARASNSRRLESESEAENIRSRTKIPKPREVPNEVKLQF